MKFKSGSLFYLKAFMVIVFLTHLIMLVDSSIHNAMACVVQNIIGCAVTTILSISKLKKTSPFTIVFCLMIHLEIQVFAAILFVGWNLQFQYYYFGTMVFSVFMTSSMESKRLSFRQKILGFSSTAMFFLSYTLSRHFSPLYHIPNKVAEYISLINYMIIFIGLAFLSNLFRLNAFHYAIKIKSQSFRDELTKLYNRRGIRAEMDRAIYAMKTEGIPYSITIFDIDDFKKINDTYGHDKGDEVLQAIGKVLLGFENELITTCRWGGEEFLILRQYSIYNNSMPDLAKKIAAKISQLEFNSDGTKFKITITAGCANSGKDLSINEVLKNADNRLYRGKETGKNKIISSDI
ncbi:GGDEF domain-containing protein [Treponema sp.]|uniref:GGDEF domain-containing protein n=1 Tax=Treponema sp. TaxID=166 RepID=UPI00298DF4C4|nr:GGDEF domain-containing protein [Treponema sp.]MCQ2242050.1 GGDEF domain-containing protein [Treponema sp.]